jgi:hypothetical protein
MLPIFCYILSIILLIFFPPPPPPPPHHHHHHHHRYLFIIADHTVCQTVHRFITADFTSIEVTKKCVQVAECTPKHVGCSLLDQSGQQVTLNFFSRNIAYS